MFDHHHSAHQTLRRIGLALALIGWIGWTALPVYCRNGSGSSSLTQDGLTLEDRINYQRALEEVYWRHRMWPKQNAAPKPALEQVMPLSTLRAKVEDYLRKSQALAMYWRRPITAEQLQAEMERMARQTKQLGVLKELWAALGNDPYVIAECLARPVLVNRLIRNWYAQDERYHGKLKARAEAELRAYGSASQMRQMSGEYREVAWATAPHPQPLSQRERVAVRPGEGAHKVVLNSSNG